MDGIVAISFDLFDTLVDHHLGRLPRVRLGAPGDPSPAIPSTVGALHDAVLDHADLPLHEFAAALRGVDRDLRESRLREGRELPTVERFAELLRRLGIDAPGLAEGLTDVHMSLLHGVTDAPPHHAAVLRALRGRVRLGLCSNFSHTPTALRVLEGLGLRAPFDALVVSESVGIRKPRREIFEALARELDVAPGAILHVGDNLGADVAGAAGAGMRTAWLTRRVPDPDAALRDYAGPPPEITVGDISELAPLVGGGSSV